MPASYDTLETVVQAARVRLMDAMQSVSGDVFTDTAPFSIVAINSAWRKMQEFLSKLGFQKFTGQTILSNLAVVSSGDPATVTRLDWAGYYNGAATQVGLVLPSDFIAPIELRERIHAAHAPFVGAGIASITRAANLVTVVTNAAHGLTGGDPVTISGVATVSFNTSGLVLGVPLATSFTFVQTGVDAVDVAGGNVASSLQNFLAMDNLSEQGLPLGPKKAWNKSWEWRGDAVYLPGALSAIDVLLRYWSFAADFVPASTTPFANQTVPILRCADSLSNYICAEVAGPRGDMDAKQFIADGEAAAMRLVARESPEVA